MKREESDSRNNEVLLDEIKGALKQAVTLRKQYVISLLRR